MPADPVSGGCGCALLLAVCALYFAGLAAWAFIHETGVLYPCVAGLALWLVFTIAHRILRCRDDGE
jgi:hypothetical protein